MPQLIALAVVGAGVYAGYRWVRTQLQRVEQSARAAEADMRRRAGERAGQPRDLGTLEYDAETGEYRPRR